jgi:site-specific DNA recombinase
VPELRIVPQDLWDRAQARRQRRRLTATGQTGGIRPRHLLSGNLVCAECDGHYIIQHHRAGVRHYGCARHYDRGPTVCQNGKLVRQDIIEQKILDHIFGDLFAPHRLAYLSRAVDAAIREGTRRSTGDLARREAALREAERKRKNILDAISEGIRTPSTKARLEDAEQQVAACEAAIREAKRPAPVVVVKTAIDRYLADLRATLEGDVDEARRLLAKGFDRIVLRRDEDGRCGRTCRGIWPVCSTSRARTGC